MSIKKEKVKEEIDEAQAFPFLKIRSLIFSCILLSFYYFTNNKRRIQKENEILILFRKEMRREMPWGRYRLVPSSWAHIFPFFFSFMTVLDIVSLEFVRLKERKSSCNGQTLTMERSRKRQGKCSSWGSNRSTAANKKEKENVHLVRLFLFLLMDGPNVLFFLAAVGFLMIGV